MSDAHVIEDIGHTHPMVHANIGQPTDAADALIDAAIAGGLVALSGDDCATASTGLTAGHAALDTEAADYQAAADFLTACISACDTHTTGEFFVNP